MEPSEHEVKVALDAAIVFAQSLSMADPRRVERLFEVGDRIFDEFLDTKKVEFLQASISVMREALGGVSEGGMEWTGCLRRLGSWLILRGQTLNSRPDLEEGTRLLRIPIDSKDAFENDCYKYLYSMTNDTSVLEEAISLQRQVVTLIPPDDAASPVALFVLASSLNMKFHSQKMLPDIEEATKLLEQASGRIDNSSIVYPEILYHLSDCLDTLYDTSGATEFLEHSIETGQQALHSVQHDDPLRRKILNLLSYSLLERHKLKGGSSDLEESIVCSREAVNICNKEEQGSFLITLLVRLSTKCAISLKEDEINEVINLGQKGLESLSRDSHLQSQYLSNLSNNYRMRYVATMEEGDLNKSLELSRKAIALAVDTTDRMVSRLSLAATLSEKFRISGMMADIDEAIAILSQMSDCEDGQRQDHSVLVNLSELYWKKFTRSLELLDIDRAIQCGEDASKRGSKYPQHQARCLHIWSVSLLEKFVARRNLQDLEKAFEIQKMTTDVALENDAAQPLHMQHLGNLLRARYSELKDINDLNQSIDISRKAVNSGSKFYDHNIIFLVNLSGMLHDRFSRLHIHDDMVESASWSKALLEMRKAEPSFRIGACCRIIAFYAEYEGDFERAYEYAELLVDLLEQYMPRSLQLPDRKHTITNVWGLASVIASVALGSGKPPEAALSFLETGRGFMMSHLGDMNKDISDLKQSYPELAGRFIDYREQLKTSEALSNNTVIGHRDATFSPPLGLSGYRSSIANEFEKTIAEIQSMPGFETFLAPLSIAEMQEAAKQGPIVVLNVSRFGGDAIIVEEQQIRRINLPQLAPSLKAKEREPSINSTLVLEWLWDTVTEPVLNALGFTEPVTDSNWPHVWWIPTGALNKFPIHAAGYHDTAPQRTVIDRVKSSYSSSIKALVQTRKRSYKLPDRPEALLVAMENTPGLQSLPFAKEEIRIVRKELGSINIITSEPGQTKQDVLGHLTRCSFLHFAGHGYVDVKDPMGQSHLLLLPDKLTESKESINGRLSISELLDTNTQENPPFMAYLSACGTGQTKAEEFFDESLHLISGCQLAGYRHVIGTIWEVHDELCVEIARETYRELARSPIQDDAVCSALHQATMKMRNKWLEERKLENEITRSCQRMNLNDEIRCVSVQTSHEKRDLRDMIPEDDDRKPSPLASWAFYVHYGV
ncbi:unnamed protein product [Clonostachys rosea]|uniref:CHAT domain-containing protein n=1 Tax=Bionectria ochroleuca TaxID=29856 RepID=A0ABY6TVE6_BIOOC|nr:unnamed protein product [Clonostachys rosea]